MNRRTVFRLNCVLILMLALLGASTAVAQSDESNLVSDEQSAGWIVQLTPGWSQFHNWNGLARTFGDARLEPTSNISDTFVARFDGVSNPAGSIARLAGHPAVAVLEPNIIYQYQNEFIPNDQLFEHQDWARTVNLPQAWGVTGGNSALIVAVLDSGVRVDHPDLVGKIIDGYNFKDDNTDVTDLVGHGTAVSGIIGASANDGVGIAGTAMNVTLMPVKVGSENGAEVVHIADGIRFAVNNGADVINISLGSEQPSATLHREIQFAYESNVAVVAAAGNDADAVSYPGSFLETISAGASTLDGSNVTNFSTRIGVVDLVAPGADVIAPYWSVNSGNTYAWVTGTSFASPIVTGTVALMRSANPGMAIEEIREALQQTARSEFQADTGGAGAGLLNSYAALEFVILRHYGATWLPVDEPVAAAHTKRSWLWGPHSFDISVEPYAEAEHGLRLVVYYDKSRMEITDVYGDQNSPWYVTNGLLVNELISGQMQVGDQHFEFVGPAEIPVAGDPQDTSGPLYSSFVELLDAPPLAEDEPIVHTLGRDGSVGENPELEGYDVRSSVFVDETGHRIADVFWEYLNSTGIRYQGGQYLEGSLFDPTYFATGFPVTNAYWSEVQVGGQMTDVLVQCFERRCLTYTPGNPDGWQVEMGNVGQHYYQWRYGPVPEGPHSPDPSAFALARLR